MITFAAVIFTNDWPLTGFDPEISAISGEFSGDLD